MVVAKATGIRRGESKLRYHTQDHSHALFSLVRGKDVWRLTGATSSLSPIKRKEVYSLHARVLALLKRLLPGEEAHPELFDVIFSFHNTITASDITKDNIQDIECIALLRIMDRLGYIRDDAGLRKLIASNEWGESIYAEVAPIRKKAIALINQAIKESQL
jgi:recombinational DNA repair protein (RecF pathway)